MNPDQLASAHCTPRKGAENALGPSAVRRYLTALPGWSLCDDAKGIRREYRFDDFHRTMAFVNAVAWIAHAEDHHPDFNVSYPSCALYFSTHDVGGLSLNDFICAARVDALLEQH